MKLLIKIIIAFCILIMALFFGLHTFVNIAGKPLLEAKLKEALNKDVRIGSVRTSPPLNIYINDIKIDGLFKAREAYIGVNFFDFFHKDLHISTVRLTRALITFEKNLPEAAAAAIVAPMQPQETVVIKEGKPVARKQRSYPPFSIGRLVVDDATISFLDKSVKSEGLLIKAEHLNVKINNFSFNKNKPGTTSFELSADLPWKDTKEKGKFSWRGWINRSKGEMQALLKIADIDGIYLYPYYSSWFDLEKARIEKAKLNFVSEMKGISNNLTAKCHLELTDIVRKQKPPEEEDKADQIAAAVMGILRALNQGKIVLDFTLRTRMDKLSLGFKGINMDLESKQ